MDRIRNQKTNRGICAAFGSFDGVHAGHAAIISRILSHPEFLPAVVLLEEGTEMFLNTMREREYLLKNAGIKNIFTVSGKSYTSYGSSTVIQALQPVSGPNNLLIAGAHHAPGSTDLDPFQANGYRLETVDPVLIGGVPIQQECIRQAFLAGRFDEAVSLLGHPHILMGTVEHGRGKGAGVGMPTANVVISPGKLLPPYGVYATRMTVRGRVYVGVCNIGPRPTVDHDPTPTIENFLLGFEGDIYGESCLLELAKYIRPIRKFSGLPEVHEQVNRDIAGARDCLDALLKENKNLENEK